MSEVRNILQAFKELPMERVNALIAVLAICLAAFALFVVLTALRSRMLK